jgi:ferric-dicitrate binding protein FerR (iron transport regulator)
VDKENIDVTLTPKQKIVVFSGKMKMHSSQPKNSMDKSSVIHSDSLPKILSPVVEKEVKTDLYTSWKDGKWIIEGEDIGDLAIQLERKFNVQIAFNSDELKKYKFTGTFQNETLEQIMKVLKMTAPLTFKIEKGRVELKIDPELRSRYKKYMKYY